MSGSKDDEGSSWTSRFLKVASAAAATVAVAGGIYAVLSSSSANSEHEAAFGEEQLYNKGGAALVAKWKKPEAGWVKLNVDGSQDLFKGPSAGCGGVVRDSSGKWVGGFAKKLGSSLKAHQTELQAILTGLQFASRMKLKKVVLESDHNSAVRMVENGVKPNHVDYDVVEQIKEKLFRFEGEVRLVVINTMANSVADRLANNARDPSFYSVYQEYVDPPINCVQYLQRDQMGCVSSF
ncbi:putative ribonuclease H protein [Vigna angularis]|uniref:RNase H type-1 domain-containing protein n=2 Tax=Phaseolus angularis TaxID=3914 RepID=A0A0S3T1Y6_PHAAN|nr:putative ribonuclease H protein [Vigna angularis]BAT99172.1 hypothetical protein VIGAN_10056800 [Vigna angularis var. angularis]